MKVFTWVNSRIQSMTWIHIGIVELCVAAFALLIAKLWPPLLSLPWYCYAIVGGVCYAYLTAFMFQRQS